jgi:hypothetical protein
MNYVTETRQFVDKLMHIQQHIRDKMQYRRSDQNEINHAMEVIEHYFQVNLVDNESKMRRFWELHWKKVKQLLPSHNHTGFASLLTKFEELDDYTKNEIWNSVSNHLSN